MKKSYIVLSILVLFGCSEDANSDYSCDEPEIKGNQSTYNGEWIYHVPGGQYYERTEAEEMFCTEEEAEDAGYRKSKR